MKSPICFLFTFMFCSMAFADNTQRLIGESNCLVVNTNPQQNERIVWNGACKDGFAEGLGVLQWFIADKPGDRYEGTMDKGRPQGLGVYVYADGRYEGEFKDGKKEGKGRQIYTDGEKYEGDFKDGLRHGIGTVTYPVGNRYEGAWKQGKYNGKGTLVYPNGARVEDDFNDGLREAQQKRLPTISFSASKFLKSTAARVAYAEQYKPAKDHKAFALSALHAWGSAAGHTTVEAAKDDALMQCNARVKTGEPPCVIFEVDGDVVKTAAAEEKALIDKFSNNYINAILDAVYPFDQVRFDEAVARLERFIRPPKKASKAAADDYARGVSEINKANYDTAIEFFSKAAAAAPGVYESYAALAVAQIKAGRFHEADAALRLALRLNLTSSTVWAAEALVLSKIESAERARLPLLAAFELSPRKEKDQTLNAIRVSSEKEPDALLRSVYQAAVPLLEVRAAAFDKAENESATAMKSWTGQATDTKIFRRPDRLSATCKNVKYPKAALNNGSEGKVNLAFLVGEYGDVLDTVVVQSSGDQDLDIEARNSLSLCKFSFPANAGVKQMWTTYQFQWILN